MSLTRRASHTFLKSVLQFLNYLCHAAFYDAVKIKSFYLRLFKLKRELNWTRPDARNISNIKTLSIRTLALRWLKQVLKI